jgi:hypothetical protein
VLDAGKEVGLKVNAEETKYTFPSRHLTAGQDINVANTFFENVANFKYPGCVVFYLRYELIILNNI